MLCGELGCEMWLGWWLACVNEQQLQSADRAPAPSPPLEAVAGDTGAPLLTTEVGTEPAAPLTWDCAALPERPLSIELVDGAVATLDVAFDDAGYLYSYDGASALVRMLRGNEPGLVTYDPQGAQQMDWAADGRLVMANTADGSLMAVDLGTGVGESIAVGISYAWGVRVDDDGAVWSANGNLQRSDPATGRTQEMFNPLWILSVFDWSPDGERLYVSGYTGGEVYALPLNADGVPDGRIERVGATPGTAHYGLGTDACGNLYLSESATSSIYRMTPTGDVTKLYEMAPPNVRGIPYGFEWGSGVGGWRADALYVTDAITQSVTEVVIGVPSRSYQP